MQDLSEKELDPIASPVFITSVHDKLREYDGMRVGQSRPCPACDSTDLRKNGYQRAAKTFARLVTEEGFEEVGLEVQQYECRACGRSFQGDLSEHFYEGCEYAKPIVDLCRLHAETHSYNACERLLQQLYGIQVDRDTIKRYDELFDDPVARETTVIGGAEASLPFLAFLFGDGDADGPPFEWFPGGRVNAAYNCIDRHLPERKNQLALIWEGNLGESRSYTYRELYREVNAVAAALRTQGVEADDVVTIYLPMVPELPVVMLACVRLGVIHNVVFAGFSADALADRLERTGSSLLITCDGYYRRGSAVAQKNKADNARIAVEQDVDVVVLDRLGRDVHLGEGYYDYDQLRETHAGAEVDPVPRAATDTLFRIYTSGTTGEPKAVDHTTGGYLAHVAWTADAVLDIKPGDTYWSLADIGWITGHSYVVYGPLALGTTTVLYNGTPDHPEKDRLWEVVEEYAVDVFYTAPTAVRAFMKWGEQFPERHDLSSLRLLGTVGEPIDERAWQWYREHIGGGECPVVDTWWQTETGAILVSTLPGVDAMKPGSAGKALPGIETAVVDPAGEAVDTGAAGELVVTRPWPAMPQSLRTGEGWGEAATRGEEWRYYPEDGAAVDDDGYLTLLGRVDDAINVAGRRFSTMELESAIATVEGVVEAAVVGADHDTTGTAVYAYVSPAGNCAEPDLRARIETAVESAIGGVATPEAVVFTPELPKTRSGKVMRRLLAAVANGEEPGDLSALRNPEILGELQSATPE